MDEAREREPEREREEEEEEAWGRGGRLEGGVGERGRREGKGW